MSLLGKMLRIDVSVPNSDPEGYSVRPSGGLIGADVGQSNWGESDYEPPFARGRTYDWRDVALVRLTPSGMSNK